jgi:hypothetical protein
MALLAADTALFITATAEQHALPGGEIRGQDAQRKTHVLDDPAIDRLSHVTGQSFAAQHAAPHDGQRPVGEGGLLHAQRRTFQFGGSFAAGIQSRHQAACRGTHDQIGADTVLLQHLNHPHMGESAGCTAAQRQSQARRSPNRLDDRWWPRGGDALPIRRRRRWAAASGQERQTQHPRHRAMPEGKLIKNHSRLC